MNKTLKRILIGFGILIGLSVIVAGGVLYKFSSETSKMTPAETGYVTDDIIAIKNDFANMFLIKDSTDYIAIDAGKDLSVIETELKKLNIDPGKIKAVFLTHSDMDHVAGLPLFTNAKLYMARNEVKMLNGEEQKIPGINNSVSRNDYVLVDDKQTLTIGTVKIFSILTEGHTSGSMCFQVNDKYLFTGDILSLHNGKLGSSVAFFDLDHEMTKKSISKITYIPGIEYILTSHWGVSKDYKDAVKDWKE